MTIYWNRIAETMDNFTSVKLYYMDGKLIKVEWSDLNGNKGSSAPENAPQYVQ